MLYLIDELLIEAANLCSFSQTEHVGPLVEMARFNFFETSMSNHRGVCARTIRALRDTSFYLISSGEDWRFLIGPAALVPCAGGYRYGPLKQCDESNYCMSCPESALDETGLREVCACRGGQFINIWAGQPKLRHSERFDVNHFDQGILPGKMWALEAVRRLAMSGNRNADKLMERMYRGTQRDLLLMAFVANAKLWSPDRAT